jgi:hypothetical protein
MDKCPTKLFDGFKILITTKQDKKIRANTYIFDEVSKLRLPENLSQRAPLHKLRQKNTAVVM